MIEANSDDPDQTAPIDLGLHCLLERLLKHLSRRQKETTFVMVGVLRDSDDTNNFLNPDNKVCYRLEKSVGDIDALTSSHVITFEPVSTIGTTHVFHALTFAGSQARERCLNTRPIG